MRKVHRRCLKEVKAMLPKGWTVELDHGRGGGHSKMLVRDEAGKVVGVRHLATTPQGTAQHVKRVKTWAKRMLREQSAES